VAGCGECGDEPSGSCATELVSDIIRAQFPLVLMPTMYVDIGLLGCNAVWTCMQVPMFQRKILPTQHHNLEHQQ
jgi:hypothetical protein